MSHTPEPWITMADGIVSAATGQIICVFDQSIPIDAAERAANERLIRAAPALLAALKLRRATANPFASPECGGLGLPYIRENLTAQEWTRRELLARAAVDVAIRLAEHNT